MKLTHTHTHTHTLLLGPVTHTHFLLLGPVSHTQTIKQTHQETKGEKSNQ